jgi:RimJ/RimL family protein N-acetyltransferase
MEPVFSFEYSHDWPLIKWIMTHPRVWPHISDDASPEPDKFEPTDHPSIAYLLARDRELPLGLWVLEQRGAVQVEVHTCLLPAAWLRDSRAIGRLAQAWLWEHCPDLERLTTTVPKNNSLALRFALACGMIEYGLNPQSYRKNGVLTDQTLLGMSRPRRN